MRLLLGRRDLTFKRPALLASGLIGGGHAVLLLLLAATAVARVSLTMWLVLIRRESFIVVAGVVLLGHVVLILTGSHVAVALDYLGLVVLPLRLLLLLMVGLEVVVSRVRLVLLLVDLTHVGAGLIVAQAGLAFLIVATVQVLACGSPHLIVVHVVRAAVDAATLRSIGVVTAVVLECLVLLVVVWVSHRVVVGVVGLHCSSARIVLLGAVVAERVRHVDVAGSLVFLAKVARWLLNALAHQLLGALESTCVELFSVLAALSLLSQRVVREAVRCKHLLLIARGHQVLVSQALVLSGLHGGVAGDQVDWRGHLRTEL